MNYKILLFLILAVNVKAQNQITNFGELYMHANASISVFSNLKNDGNFTGTGGTLFFSGSTVQSITGSTMIDVFNLTNSNSSTTGIVFTSNSIQVGNLLTLTDGTIQTSSTNLLILKDNATVSGASNASYVEGPMKKIGNDAFTFPIGNIGNLQTLSISSPALVTDAFTAQYIHSNPTTTFGATMGPGINHVSYCEYWDLRRTSGSSNVNTSLSFDANSCGISLLSDLVVAHWDTSNWVNFGNGGVTGTISNGTISTVPTPFSFGIMTLSSSTNENPLPIELLSFDAKQNESDVELIWQTATEKDNDYFEIEKSMNGIDFDFVGKVDATGNSSSLTSYSLFDRFPFNGESYYRLKQTNVNGSYTYSELKSVNFGEASSLTIYPNPSNGNFISLSSTNSLENSEIRVLDFNGKIIFQTIQSSELKAGNTIQIIFPSPIIPGMYLLEVENQNQKTTSKFIVN